LRTKFDDTLLYIVTKEHNVRFEDSFFRAAHTAMGRLELFDHMFRDDHISIGGDFARLNRPIRIDRLDQLLKVVARVGLIAFDTFDDVAVAVQLGELGLNRTGQLGTG
jgi:hypothetical protein